MIRNKQNPLEKFFYKNNSNLIHKWLHYFDIYHRHFEKYRKKKIVVLEFGVYHGGSLRMWRDYFGKKARIVGVDINPRCKELENEGIEVFIGDQEDPKFLRKLMRELGSVDIVIEDGGHTMKQQKTTFKEVYPYVSDGGVFLIEDLHTSYWKEYGGGYKKSGTFIEYTKELIDELNAYHSQDKKLHKKTAFTTSTMGMHIYDSIVVFDKGKVEPPEHRKTGHTVLGDY